MLEHLLSSGQNVTLLTVWLVLLQRLIQVSALAIHSEIPVDIYAISYLSRNLMVLQ